MNPTDIPIRIDGRRKPHSPEAIAKLRASLKAKWASGTHKPTPKSARVKAGLAVRKTIMKKLSEGWKPTFGRDNPEVEARRLASLRKAMTKERREKAGMAIRKAYAEGRVKMRPKEERIANARKAGKTMTPVKLEKNRAIGRARIGKPGVGGYAADEGNAHAHRWTIRSPEGIIFTFTNLALWARNNEHLFLPDERPYSKTKLSKRINHGIVSLFAVDGKSCSYRGWTSVSRIELVNGGGDILGRDVAVISARR